MSSQKTDPTHGANITYRRELSSASFKIDEITAFSYGPTASRFWMMRKMVNSLSSQELERVPFFAWQCLTLYTKERELNLVVPGEANMRILLQFLIMSLQTCDGARDSAL